MPSIGETAPDFVLPNQDEKPIRLSDFRGKKVILFVYPAAFTGGCTTQACGFRDQFPKLETNGIVVLGLSPDAPDVQKKWAEKEGLQYNLLSDPDHKVMEEWGAWGEKTSFGKTTVGVIRSHWVIDENGKVIDEQLGVSATDSVEKAVKALGW